MPRSYEARLTAEHLARGRPRDFKGCPLSLACSGAAPGVVFGVRGDGTVVVRSAKDRYGADALISPDDAARVRLAVEMIDQGMADGVAPFNFTFEA